MAKKNQTKTKKLMIRSALVLIIALAGLGVVVSGEMSQRASDREKKSFSDAQAFVDAKSNEIQENIGMADSKVSDNRCKEHNFKFDRGPISCYVSEYLLYDKKDVTAANSLMNRVADLSQQSIRSTSETGLTQFIAKDRAITQSLYQDYPQLSLLSCGINYFFGSTVSTQQLHPTSDDNLQIYISCSGAAKKAYFPLKN